MVEVISFVSKAQKQSGVPEEGTVQTDIETRTGWDMNIEMGVARYWCWKCFCPHLNSSLFQYHSHLGLPFFLC